MNSKRRLVGGAITALGLVAVELALLITTASRTEAFAVVDHVHHRRGVGGGAGDGGATTTDASSRGGRLFFLGTRPRLSAANPSSTTLFLSSRLRTHESEETDSPPSSLSTLEGVLVQYGYGRRLMKISPSELPVLAEVYVNGTARLARIVEIHTDGATSSSGASGPGFDPKVTVETFPGNASMAVDFKQITTILKDIVTMRPAEAITSAPSAMPAPSVVERTLDQLYHSYVGRGRDLHKGGLSKKQVGSVVEQFPPDQQPYVDQILRHALKAGSGLTRLVDVSIVRTALFPGGRGNSKSRGSPDTTTTALTQTRIALDVLSRDAANGRGRFKRWPCTAVARTPSDGLCFLNGGWVVVDRNVRAGSEARQFAAGELRTSGATWTPADLRIAQRLECLAMGEALSSSSSVVEAASSARSRQRLPVSPWTVPELPTSLERDVRETLRAMNLPATPGGAKEALVRVGRWMGTGDFSLIEPWSKDVLKAAAWYSAQRLSARDDDDDASRVDLTGYPSLCVDAQRTSFRDDAMGIRPRAGTGRKVIPEASKWEVMIHIVDVTDIYSDSPEPNLATLRQASKSRGTSRYDLPLGPLHLLPPRVLESLSLSRRLESSHRCITVWAYIDERDGSLLDVGLERTLIRSPILLSFRDASAVLERTDPAAQGTEDTRIRVLLMALERSLSRWVDNRMRASESAQKRDSRLSQREQEAAPYLQYLLDDSGRTGFQRSRGHRLVDAALDLYSCGVFNLLREAKAPVPESKGADSSRGGRLATAPLRRYVDGEAQRQAVAVLCQHGRILTATECKEIGKASNQARNSVKNIRATRR